MKKKIAKAHELFQANIDLYRCPICGAGFREKTEPGLECVNGHNFDLARNGYCNLLAGSMTSTYELAAFQARRAVFAAGFFAPLLDVITKMLREKFEHRPFVLDAGCGEGSLLAELAHRLARIEPVLLGVDIAKEAVRLAGAFNLPIMWAVADLAALPLFNENFDAVLNVLSPANYNEFKRILKPRGVLIKVIPGSDHLQEIRALTDGPAAPYCNQAVLEGFQENAVVKSRKRLRYQTAVLAELWPSVVCMTPLSRHKTLRGEPAPQVTVDLEILTGTFSGRDFNE